MRAIGYFFVTFIVVAACAGWALQQEAVWRFILSESVDEHFYIPHEWSLKMRMAQRLKAETTPKIIISGSSRSTTGIDPQELPPGTHNLALTSSSVEQFLKVASLAVGRASDVTVVVELNPVAFTDRFIMTARQYSQARVLSLESSIWNDWSPFRYGPMLSSVMGSILELRSSDTSVLAEDKLPYYWQHFVESDLPERRGFLRIEPLEELSLKKRLFRDCVATTRWALRDSDTAVGIKFALEKMNQWRSQGYRVLAVSLPVHPDFIDETYQKHLARISKSISSAGFDVIDLQGAAGGGEEWFNDCVHLNRIGAKHVTSKLAAEVARK